MHSKSGPGRYNGKADTLVVIPAFNEQRNIARVVQEVQASLPEADILVINDCSFDETSAVARGINDVKVIDLPCNLG